jgi:hypothetical protein
MSGAAIWPAYPTLLPDYRVDEGHCLAFGPAAQSAHPDARGSKSRGLPASRCRNWVVCLDQGAPVLPSSSVTSDPILRSRGRGDIRVAQQPVQDFGAFRLSNIVREHPLAGGLRQEGGAIPAPHFAARDLDLDDRAPSCLPHTEQRKRAAHSALADQCHSVMCARRAARKISIGQRAGGRAYGLHRETPAQILYCRWIRTESGE